MRFYRNLYVSPGIKHPAVTKWRLRHNAGSLAVYVLMLGGDSKSGHLEFCHCVNLHQSWYKKRDPYIIGIAEGRWQAILMMRDIVQETLEHTGGTDVVSYLFPDGRPSYNGRKKRGILR